MSVFGFDGFPWKNYKEYTRIPIVTVLKVMQDFVHQPYHEEPDDSPLFEAAQPIFWKKGLLKTFPAQFSVTQIPKYNLNPCLRTVSTF